MWVYIMNCGTIFVPAIFAPYRTACPILYNQNCIFYLFLVYKRSKGLLNAGSWLVLAFLESREVWKHVVQPFFCAKKVCGICPFRSWWRHHTPRPTLNSLKSISWWPNTKWKRQLPIESCCNFSSSHLGYWTKKKVGMSM